MKNTLKIALLVIGAALSGYGIYTIATPEFSLDAGPLSVEVHGDNTQAYAMLAFGVLVFLAGLALRKR